MTVPSSPLFRTAVAAGWTLVCVVAMTACAGHLASEPGVFDARRVEIALPHRRLHLTCITPQTPRSPRFLILFATGDAGWLGASKTVFDHLAEQGYDVAAYNSREAIKVMKRAGGPRTPAQTSSDFASMIAQAKGILGLPEETLTIPTGVSRGAGTVVYVAADPNVQAGLAGTIAIALPLEADHLRVPRHARSQTIHLDKQGRLQTYPVLTSAGPLPVAVIQSTGDKYVPAAEARRLLGPDTPTRRLYTVQASNHGFRGGRDELLRDLDDALAWIGSVATPGTTPPARVDEPGAGRRSQKTTTNDRR